MQADRPIARLLHLPRQRTGADLRKPLIRVESIQPERIGPDPGEPGELGPHGVGAPTIDRQSARLACLGAQPIEMGQEVGRHRRPKPARVEERLRLHQYDRSSRPCLALKRGNRRTTTAPFRSSDRGMHDEAGQKAMSPHIDGGGHPTRRGGGKSWQLGAAAAARSAAQCTRSPARPVRSEKGGRSAVRTRAARPPRRPQPARRPRSSPDPRTEGRARDAAQLRAARPGRRTPGARASVARLTASVTANPALAAKITTADVTGRLVRPASVNHPSRIGATSSSTRINEPPPAWRRSISQVATRMKKAKANCIEASEVSAAGCGSARIAGSSRRRKDGIRSVAWIPRPSRRGKTMRARRRSRPARTIAAARSSDIMNGLSPMKRSVIGESKKPGTTTLQAMPCGASAARSPSPYARTPALLAL